MCAPAAATVAGSSRTTVAVAAVPCGLSCSSIAFAAALCAVLTYGGSFSEHAPPLAGDFGGVHVARQVHLIAWLQGDVVVGHRGSSGSLSCLWGMELGTGGAGAAHSVCCGAATLAESNSSACICGSTVRLLHAHCTGN
jgi:hypothetical protein